MKFNKKEDGAEKYKSLMKNQVVDAARFNAAPPLVISLDIIFEWLLSLVKSLGDLLFA